MGDNSEYISSQRSFSKNEMEGIGEHGKMYHDAEWYCMTREDSV